MQALLFIIYLLLVLFLFSVGAQLFYLRFRSGKSLSRFLEQQKDSEIPPQSSLPEISIVICAKNEAPNLHNNLPAILNQNYPSQKWEVIVVDDASTDDSGEILISLQHDYPRLKIISITPEANRQFPGKKQALDLGIRSASYAVVLLTDADCYPVSRDWIMQMALAFSQQKKTIIAGYSAYEKKPGFLNKFIRWETLQTAIQYAGMILAGKPYMGVGRNLMYRKEHYLKAMKNTAFVEKYTSIPMGDDDLLMNQICNPQNTGPCLNPKAFTLSQPKTSYGSWLGQKSRHLSTGKFYPRKIKNILGLWALSQALFWLIWPIILILWAINLSNKDFHLTAFSLLTGGVILGLLRLMIYWYNAGKWYQALEEKKLLPFYPIGEFCQSVMQLILLRYLFWRNKKQWN